MNQPLIKTGLRYGIIGTLVFIAAYTSLAFIFKNPPFSLPVPLHALALFLFIFGAAYELRTQQQSLHFWQGGAIGVIVYLCIAIGSVFCIHSLFAYGDQVIEWERTARLHYASINQAQMENYVGVEGVVEQKIQEIRTFGAWRLAINNYLWINLIIGLFLSIFVAFLLRKKKVDTPT
ncbi:DUF4199 domain-containing protein [Persicobacter psychrovividus]